MFESLEDIDRRLLLQINAMHTPFMDGMMWFMSLTWPTFLLVFVAAFYFYRHHTLKKAAELLLGCAIVFACTDLSTNLIKHAVKRYRPTHNLEIQKQIHLVYDYSGGQYGFFSGHAANTFGIITFIFLCIQWVPVKYRLYIFIYPLLVVYSRMYLGVHYPSDIITGVLSGLLFGSLVFYIMNRYFLKLNVENA